MFLNIKLTESQHEQLASKAKAQGLSVEHYVLSRSLPDENLDDGLEALEQFLQPRVEAAQRGEYSTKSVDDIFNEVVDSHINR